MRPLGFKPPVLIRSAHFIQAFFCLCACALTWASRHDPFFWDTVQLASKHAHFFYENGLHWQLLPQEIDSGHPPVFGYYLAMVWTFFGKTLPASHFAMLPFLLLNVLLLWRIGHRMAENGAVWLLALVFLDPVLLGQYAMVSPDVVVVTSLLLAVEGVLGRRKVLILLGILGLCAISMRGMMTAAALLVWAVALPFSKNIDFRKVVASTLPFLPGFVFAAWFLGWHWQAAGWVGYHPDSPWAGAFQPVGTTGFLRNMAVVGWRWLDFGRMGTWAALGFYGYSHKGSSDIKRLLFQSPVFSLLLCLLVFLLPSALLYQNLSAHRYFLPAFVAFHLLVFQLFMVDGTSAVKKTDAMGGMRQRMGKGVLLAVVLLLATGNLWRYPRGISMDWDSTLAHWPYHRLRADAVRFLDEKNIDFSQVGSAFPNLNTGENLMLNGDLRQFSAKDFDRNQFVFASNVFNDFSLADYTVLENGWTLVWRKKQGAVWIEIYEKRIEKG